ncbi:MAG: DoxX family protein [Rhodospirillales bacterium]|nr:DoxX family protein [Rhodospirillales bacterium]
MPRWSYLDRFTDLGLLVLRAGIGAIFLLIHGLPRLVADSRAWARVGRAVGYLGIHFGHAWWGLIAILAMTAGAICLILGFLHRPAALALTLTMAVATRLPSSRDSWSGQIRAGAPLTLGRAGAVVFWVNRFASSARALESWRALGRPVSQRSLPASNRLVARCPPSGNAEFRFARSLRPPRRPPRGPAFTRHRRVDACPNARQGWRARGTHPAFR